VLLAIPPVTIVKHEMRRIARAGAHAHEMFDAGSNTDDFSRIEHLHDRRNREQVELCRCQSRDVLSSRASKL
jgi:hypothetical protein